MCVFFYVVVFFGQKKKLLGHNEDALAETLGHFYFVSAHVVNSEPKGKWKTTEEKFTSLCYAGMLPGFTMSYNRHGFVFSINVIRVKNMQSGKTRESSLEKNLKTFTKLLLLLSLKKFLQRER